jgi:hypothetical protein
MTRFIEYKVSEFDIYMQWRISLHNRMTVGVTKSFFGNTKLSGVT